MPEVSPREGYSRKEVRRVLGISARQLRSWERQELIPRLASFGFSDLIALRTLQKLRQDRVSAGRIRRAVTAIRSRLATGADPLRELRLFCEGRKVAVVVDGQKLEPVSGQLLLDFDDQELRRLVDFPQGRGANASRSRENEAESWFQKGLDLESAGAPAEEIIAAYQKAVSLDAHSAGALVNLGTIYYRLRNWKEAERYYKQALAADPTYALAHFNLGNLFDEQGDRARAQSHYEAALRLSPGYADAHYNLALLAQSRGDLMTAVRHWQAYLKLDPTSSWAAIARRELGKLKQSAVVHGATTDAVQAGEEG